MNYAMTQRSRQYFTVFNVVFPFAIGFVLWQVILSKGLDLVDKGAAQGASFGYSALARTLIWGSPLYAFCGCAAFLALIWYAETSLNFSHQRRLQHLKLGIIVFIASVLLSVLGIFANFPDKPPFDLLYTPIIHALNS